MKYLIIFSSLFFINFTNLFSVPITQAAVENVEKIVFTTESQTIAPDVISKVFTIQTQNSSGAMETIDETADLSVTVNSSSGQFNSNSTTWNPNTTFTMNKNTGNKNFYYKDNTEGTYNITATLTTRTTGKSWSTSQSVIISSVIPESDSDSGDDNEATTTSGVAISSSSTSNSTNLSTHYIQESLSSYTETNLFEISAGRDRLGYIGTPLIFEAKYKMSSNLKNKDCDYVWNFGDGRTDSGEETEHLYKYSGNYNLVLNGNCGETKAVARLKVKIMEPDLALEKFSDGSIQVLNKSTDEINLYGLKLVTTKQEYNFPLDTIIGAGQGIVFSYEYTNLDTLEKVVLSDSFSKTLAILNSTPILAETGTISLEELKRFVDNYLD